ncbi:MAG TPA: CoA transferase [Dehalococcoidia bacterium]|nr:CoA transferase [Dehalococcoidia bacterium]
MSSDPDSGASTPSGPLEGILVVDLATERAELAGRILADLGAEVIKIEPPAGARSRLRPPYRPGSGESLYWAAVALNKKSAVLDLRNPADREKLGRLLRSADALIESFDPGQAQSLGFGFETVSRENPRIVYVSVSPYGQDGPKAHWPATELTAEAAGGLANLQGDRDRPPIPVGYPQAAFHAGAQAAADAVVALYERDGSGLGQHLDVSMQTAMVWTLMNATGYPPNTGENPPGSSDDRDGPERDVLPGLRQPRRLWECADGYAVFSATTGQPGATTLDNIARWMEEEDALEPDFRGQRWASWRADVAEGRLSVGRVSQMIELAGQFFKQKTKAELLSQAVDDSLLLAPIYTLEDIAADPQLASRHYWTELDGHVYPGPFAKFERTPIRYRSPAPVLGQHQSRLEEIVAAARVGATPTQAQRAGRRPFAGLKVADFAWIGAGPMVTKQLADHGATVVHVESSLRPDVLRAMPPFKDGTPGIDRSQFVANFNSSKLGIALDLASPGGHEVARRLVDWSDLVVESFTPGTMANLGLGWDSLKHGRPDLIMMSSCLRGQTGPEHQYGGFGGQGAALAGIHSMTGWPDRPPSGPWGAYTDFIAPRYSLAALVAALLEKRRTGLGQYIDISQVESALHFLEPLLLDHRENGNVPGPAGHTSPFNCPHGIYRCRGHERYVAIEIDTETQLAALTVAMGLNALEGPKFSSVDARRAENQRTDKAIALWCAEKDAFEAEEILVDAGVPAAVVQRPSDLYCDPQLAHRGFFVTCQHSEMGPTPYDGPVTTFSVTPAKLSAGPGLGEHTEMVLSEILGFSDDEITEYTIAGVFI